MTLEQIVSFIAIAENGTMAKAAEILFITQPTLSRRIESLEQELGTTLLERRRGRHEIELTDSGKVFMNQAYKWKNLYEETLISIRQSERQQISIALPYSLTYSLSSQLTNEFLSHEFPITCKFQALTSAEILNQVEQRQIDLGLINSQFASKKALVTPLAAERIVILVNNDSSYGDYAPITDFDTSQEVFVGWGTEFDTWHDYNIGSQEHSSVWLNSYMFLEGLLSRPGRWAFVTESIARELCRRHPVHICRTNVSLPQRSIYTVTPVGVKSTYIEFFLDDIRNVLRTRPEFSLF